MSHVRMDGVFAIMKLFAAVVNTYGCIGSEFKDFCAAIEADKRGSARGRSLGLTLSLLGVYANAEKVLQIHTPPYQRAQKQEVLSAIAEKDAALAAAEASRPPGEVPNAAPWREQVAEWLRLLE